MAYFILLIECHGLHTLMSLNPGAVKMSFVKYLKNISEEYLNLK